MPGINDAQHSLQSDDRKNAPEFVPGQLFV